MNPHAKVPKKLAVINDFTGYGRCSHAVAIPVVSVMGIQACPVPSAVFSNHMAYPHWHKMDYTPYLPEYFACWEKLNLHFDGILCGFLDNEDQVLILADFMEKQKRAGETIVILDPVMGDSGTCYSSVSPAYADSLKKLLPLADIITPNLTEACLLTDTPYPESMPDNDFLSKTAEKLHAMGPSKLVITGITQENNFHNYFSTLTPSRQEAIYTTEAGGPSRPGTGDLFASIIAADALNGTPFEVSVKKAADFVRTCTEGSAAAGIPIRDGVCFENYLSLIGI